MDEEASLIAFPDCWGEKEVWTDTAEEAHKWRCRSVGMRRIGRELTLEFDWSSNDVCVTKSQREDWNPYGQAFAWWLCMQCGITESSRAGEWQGLYGVLRWSLWLDWATRQGGRWLEAGRPVKRLLWCSRLQMTSAGGGGEEQEVPCGSESHYWKTLVSFQVRRRSSWKLSAGPGFLEAMFPPCWWPFRLLRSWLPTRIEWACLPLAFTGK